MRNFVAILAVSTLGCLAGCNSPPTTSPPAANADFGGWSWYGVNDPNTGANDVDVCASWGNRNQRLVYIILSDVNTSATTNINASGGRTDYNVDLTLANGQTLEIRIETADGITGTAAYAGQSYDLAQGSVFVLLPKGEKLEMLQLKRDISQVNAGVSGVLKFVRSDPELLRMFARVK